MWEYADSSRRVHRGLMELVCVFKKEVGRGGERQVVAFGEPESGNDTWFRIMGTESGGGETMVVQREVEETGSRSDTQG